MLISVKPIAWPLIIWLLATRRYRGVAWAAACGIVLNVVAWTILGFGQIHQYIVLMHAFQQKGERISFTFVAFLLHLGVARTSPTCSA